MIFLAIAVVLFSLVHLVPAMPGIKANLKDRFGSAYGGLFAVAATVTLLGIIAAWSMAQFVPVFEPSANGRYINMALSFVAFLLLGVFAFRGKLRQVVRYPFALAVVFWAIGHLSANGDLASLVLFGGLLIFAIVFIILSLANKVFPPLIVRDGHDILSLVMGGSVFIVMVQLHEVVIGVPVIRIEQFFGG